MSGPAVTPRVIPLGPRDFITSDLHIGGAPWPYSMWGFKTPMAWASKVADIWDYQVNKHSTIVVVGDALEGYEGFGASWIKSWYGERPGRKILVPGNHDAVHPEWEQTEEHLKAQGWFDVFEVVEPNTALLELPEGQRAAVCHFAHTTHGERWQRWKHTNHALPLVHGHNHARQKVTLPSRRAQKALAAQGRVAWGLTQIHVGWAAWRKLAPVPAVEALIAEELPAVHDLKA